MFLAAIQRKMCHVLMINFLMILEKAVSTLGLITLHDKKIKSNNYQFLCVLRLINKILTKTLTLRLKNTIANIINEFQSCGPNRSIINNALNLKSIIKYIRQNDQNYAIISLDQEKAFDRIEHNFLKRVLQKYDFPPNFIKWFEILYRLQILNLKF